MSVDTFELLAGEQKSEVEMFHAGTDILIRVSCSGATLDRVSMELSPHNGTGKEPGQPNGEPPVANGEPPAEVKKTARRVGAKPPIEREPYALWCIGLKNPIRKKLLEVVEWKSFEAFILIAIMGTCLCLAVFQPMPNGDSTAINEFLVRPRTDKRCPLASLHIIAGRNRNNIYHNFHQ